jgi:DNA primase
MSTLSQAIRDQVAILDLCEEFSVRAEPFSGGSFTHRCRCPYHKGGSERTPSLYIDNNNNSFKCFGCDAGSSVIQFYNLIFPDYSERECVLELKERVNTKIKYKRRIIQNNFMLLLESSGLFRYYNQKYPERWMEVKHMQKIFDEKMKNVDYNDVATTSKIIYVLRKALRKRFS